MLLKPVLTFVRPGHACVYDQAQVSSYTALFFHVFCVLHVTVWVQMKPQMRIVVLFRPNGGGRGDGDATRVVEKGAVISWEGLAGRRRQRRAS